MAKSKTARQRDNLIWIDLEMTGLDLPHDVILEISTIVTDNELNIIAFGPDLVIHHSNTVLETMNEWCKKQHSKSGLVTAVQHSTITLQQAEQQVIDFLLPYCKPDPGVVCGNSVWQDKAFIQWYMPRLNELMHYKIIDVSSVKELVMRWYPKSPFVEFKKMDSHRALTDIQESIEELKHYRKHFFIPPIVTS